MSIATLQLGRRAEYKNTAGKQLILVAVPHLTLHEKSIYVGFTTQQHFLIPQN